MQVRKMRVHACKYFLCGNYSKTIKSLLKKLKQMNKICNFSV